MTVDVVKMLSDLHFQIEQYQRGYVSFETLMGYVLALVNNGLLSNEDMADLFIAIEEAR